MRSVTEHNMRENGYWRRGFRLVRVVGYDNTQAQRDWLPITGMKGTWCWAVREEDLQSFHGTYADTRRQTLQPQRDAIVVAVPWRQLDAYICGRSNVVPTVEEFDPERHMLRKETRTRTCWCGCGAYDGSEEIFATNYAIFAMGKMRRRHRKKARI